MTDEVWKPVAGSDGYEVSSKGRVRRHGEVRKGSDNGCGYRICWVVYGSGRKSERKLVHRLVAEVFIGPSPFEGAEVRHLDGDQGNNEVSNLAWGTHRENMQDIDRHGRRPIGEKVPTAKLTNDQARRVVELSRSGVAGKELARQFGVSPMTISRVICGRKYQRVTGVPSAPQKWTRRRDGRSGRTDRSRDDRE